MLKSTITQNALCSVHSDLTGTAHAQGIVKTTKENARLTASAWFTEWFKENDSIEDIPAELSKNALALKETGFFGSSEAKVKEGSRKSVASHNCEAALRFFARVWKAEYSETFDCILAGSTSLRFEQLNVKAEKTAAERIIEDAVKGGLYASSAERLAILFEELMEEQTRDTMALHAIATERAAKEKEAADIAMQEAAAVTMAKVTGRTVEECLAMIENAKAA